jgi:hypothetical protein
LQFSTDCGSETTVLYGLVNALRCVILTTVYTVSLTNHHPRVRFHSDYDNSILPAHVYLRSVHNISIERSWLRLRLDFGDNVVQAFLNGVKDGYYKPHDTNEQYASICLILLALTDPF